MASMRDIKRRKGSIQSTQQITKAMKLVSTVKLQRSKAHAEQTKSYFSCMYDTVKSMIVKAGALDHPYLKTGASDKKAVVVITSNRGLAGGYNSNVVKLITRGELAEQKENLIVHAIGKKGRDLLARAGYQIAEKDYSEVIEEPTYVEAMKLAEELLKSYMDGEIGEIYLAYTYFKNTVVHEPKLLKLLPVSLEDVTDGGEEGKDAEADKAMMNFEPEADEALNLIIPKYVASLIYGALVEAVASENGARMQAMDSATSNAEEMIGKLSLQYNRARQGSITQELTEIIAGAEAIS
ncbi:MAG: ATP synthase F1 subunit gamma [Lachnospiraceae bacterium]|nr:ATP synthase F1 subunit gamma [Lachnospiraceae bacterium]MDE7239016.1 ATP synthase F1 subunit gamma [Lachnospiraceae bacterium]